MMVETVKGINQQYRADLKSLYDDTIQNNPYIPYKPYLKQALPIYYSMLVEHQEDNVKKPNDVLVGAGGFGGKSFLGAMLAVQYLQQPDYTCLVTRRNYAELLDTNSIWDNLIDWCCGDHLPDYLKCEVVKSPTPKITAPNGNTIYFKAFDRAEKKQKLKSASYDRIINDEASELPIDVLKFQFRSLRNTSKIPRSRINLSNPGGESTDYLVEHFVDGDKPYISLDWRDNPFIDKEAYEGSLNELDYIDQQYQKYGNWHYKPSQGDLITRTVLESSVIKVADFREYKPLFNIIAIDLAGTGRDNTCASSVVLFENGLAVLVDMISISSSYPEEKLYRFIEKNIKKYDTYKVLFEEEPGSDSLYSMRHWKSELQDLMYTYGMQVSSVRPLKSKFNRARPVARAIIQGMLRISEQVDTSQLFEQFISISPDAEIMKKQKSPDELDSFGYAYHEIMKTNRGGVRVR